MTNKVRAAEQRAGVGQSGEDYLEAVLVLGRKAGPVRVTALARRLGVSKPSVVAALSSLERKGLARHERYGGVELTAAGRKVAATVFSRHRLLCEFLEGVLGVGRETAERDACRIEHGLSPETVQRLIQFVRRMAGADGAR